MLRLSVRVFRGLVCFRCKCLGMAIRLLLKLVMIVSLNIGALLIALAWSITSTKIFRNGDILTCSLGEQNNRLEVLPKITFLPLVTLSEDSKIQFTFHPSLLGSFTTHLSSTSGDCSGIRALRASLKLLSSLAISGKNLLFRKLILLVFR